MLDQSERAHWDDRYRSSERPPWDTGRVSAELMRRLHQQGMPFPIRAIELGCGTGTNAIWLAQNYFDVTAVDISPTAIALATERARAAAAKVRFVVADVTDLPDLGPPFGFFFDRGCYHAVRRTKVEAFLAELDRITAPGAIGIVLTGNAREQHDPGPPVVSEEQLRAELGRYFDFLSLEEFRFDQVEGVGVRFLGWSCLLRKRVVLKAAA